MTTINQITFFFANQQRDGNGDLLGGLPPESHSFTEAQVRENLAFAVSTGETIIIEVMNDNAHTLRIVNGFYFGTGKYGSLLSVRYDYADGTKGWVKNITFQSANAENLTMVTGSWTDGKTFEDILVAPEYTGLPLIGLESDFVEIQAERILPGITLNATSPSYIVNAGADVIINYSGSHFCSGEITYRWIYDISLITPLEEGDGYKSFSINEQGTHTISLEASNICGQKTTVPLTFEVSEASNCELSMTPNSVKIFQGDAVSFDALHPYSETGEWIYDETIELVEKDDKKLTLRPSEVGTYSIAYQVGECIERSVLMVISAEYGDDFPDPSEPAAPVFEDLPPEVPGEIELFIEMADATKPKAVLHHLPNIMKRNARYRGHRESEKFLNDHQEQTYDIRKLHLMIGQIQEEKMTSVKNWFQDLGITSMIMEFKEKQRDGSDVSSFSEQSPLDSEGDFKSPMIKLSGNDLSTHAVGINETMRRARELDERIAEGERRFRDYENAYK